MDLAGQRLEDIQETADANAELWLGDFASGGCRIKQLRGEAPKVSTNYLFIYLFYVLLSLK
jgi:hypothetical protein